MAGAVSAHSPGGQGGGMMMGPGMMGQGMGPSMMGQGQVTGPGMMGRGGMAALPQDLTVENVRHMLEHHLACQGNDRFRLGKVEEKDAGTIMAEIVTQDGSLVQRLQVGRHPGWMQPAS